jgi:hypothetical protein
MVGHLSAGGDQFLPGSTMSPGPFLWLTMVLFSKILAPMPLPQSSDMFHRSTFPRDLLVLHFRLHYFWTGLHLSWIGLRRFMAGRPLFSTILHICYQDIHLLFKGTNYGSNFHLARLNFFSQTCIHPFLASIPCTCSWLDLLLSS